MTAQVPTATLPVTFGLLLNLVGVMGADATREQVWGYLGNYIADADPAKHPELDRLVGHALAYNRDFVAPTLVRRAPEGVEVAALERLDADLAAMPADASAEDIQNRSTRSARPAGSRTCATGSRRCTRRCSARARPAHGQLHRALRHRQHPPADRRGAR